jgi:hypothetical protein
MLLSVQGPLSSRSAVGSLWAQNETTHAVAVVAIGVRRSTARVPMTPSSSFRSAATATPQRTSAPTIRLQTGSGAYGGRNRQTEVAKLGIWT